MKKVFSVILAVAMMFSMVFISDAISSNNPFSAQAQEVTTKKKNGGLASKVAGGGKYVYRKAKQGGYYVYRGGKYVGKAAYRGGKYVATKSVKGTKYVGKKAVGGTKKAFSKTKKVVVGN